MHTYLKLAVALLSVSLSSLTAVDRIIDQASDDITVLSARALIPLNYYDGMYFNTFCTDCNENTSISNVQDIEKAFGGFAFHAIDLNKNTAYCRVLEIETLTKKRAFDNAEGLGFYASYSKGHYIKKSNLGMGRKVIMKDGQEGLVHKFIGLANCWEGTIMSSENAIYSFNPFLRFTGRDGTIYNNWDRNFIYSITPQNNHFDHSKEQLHHTMIK